MIYITGDTHGKFERVFSFCEAMHTCREDVLIILGDAGINYYGGKKDICLKEKLAELPVTLFCLHGNHEARPASTGQYELCLWNGGQVYVEDGYAKHIPVALWRASSFPCPFGRKKILNAFPFLVCYLISSYTLSLHNLIHLCNFYFSNRP